MSTVPQKSKGSGVSTKIIYIALAVAAVIVLVCGGVFVWLLVGTIEWGPGVSYGGGGRVDNRATFPTGENATTLPPETVIKAFFAEVANEQLSAAYDRTTVGFQGRVSLNMFSQIVQQNKPLIGHLNRRMTQVSQGERTRTYKGYVGGGPYGGVTEFTLTVFNSPDGWRVDEFSAK
jgi:hypothetical protein